MAVHEPGTRVVGLESEHQVSTTRKHGHITTRGVGRVEGRGGVGISTGSLGEDEEVVAVEMDWVRNGVGGLDDEVGPLVGSGELDDTGLVGPVGFAVVDLEKRGIGPFNGHGGAAEVPFEEVADLADSDGKVVTVILGADGLGDVGDKVGKVFIVTVVGLGVGRCGGVRGAARVVADDTTNVVGIIIVGAGGLRDSAEPVVGGGLVGLDNDIVTLANTDAEDLGGVRDNWNQVHGDDSDVMAIN